MSKEKKQRTEPAATMRKPYERPTCQTYSMTDVLREVGPAIAIYGITHLAP